MTRNEMVELAQEDEVSRKALLDLDPYVFVGLDGGSDQEYTDGSLTLYDPETGEGSMSELYLQDRAAMLTWKIRYDTGMQDDNDAPHDGVKPYNDEWDTSAVAGNWDFVDYTIRIPGGAPLTLAIDGTGLSTSDHQIVFGSKNAESITGAGDVDHLYGMAGNDTLRGNDGDDRVEGGFGNDRLYGGDENDIVYGGQGDDTVYGDDDEAADITIGGDDELHGGEGVDVMFGEGGADTLYGDAGNDRLYGDKGNDKLYGGEDHDILAGYKGDDTLEGGEGYDIYAFGSGIFNGEGTDTVIDADGWGAVYYNNKFLTGASNNLGSKWIDTPGSGGPASMYYRLNDTTLTINDYYTTTKVVIQNWQNGDLGIVLGGESDNVFAGTDGDDQLSGNGGDDVMVGKKGNDTYFVDDLGDIVVEHPGEGTDAVESGISYTLPSNLENLSLAGSAYKGIGNALSNTITGNGQDNELEGLDGNDTLTGGGGDDLLTGGAGGDRYDFSLGDGWDAVREYAPDTGADVLAMRMDETDLALVTSDGNDLLVYYGESGQIRLENWFASPERPIERVEFNNGVVWDSATLESKINRAPVSAVPLADLVANEDEPFTYTLPANAFSDPNENDVLGYTVALADGGALPGWLVFDAAARTFSGLPGNYDVGSLAIRVTVTDHGGLTVSDSFDLTIANVNDAPTLNGGVANQQATENSHFALQLPSDLFSDIDPGDQLAYVVTLADGKPLPAWLMFDATAMTLGGQPASADVGSLGLKVVATDQAGATAETIFTLEVLPLPDRDIEGTDAGDTLTGGMGNDTLNGGLGADRMNGGAGNDTYVVDNPGDAVTEIAGQGTDTINSGITYTLGAHVENLVLTGAAAINATGNALDNIITGNGANNRITGGAGNDSLNGGDGNDTFLLITGGDSNGLDQYDGGSGTNTIIGGWSYDTLHVSNNLANLANIQVIDGGDGQWRYNTIVADDTSGASLDFSNISVRNFILAGNVGDDSITGTAGNDYIRGAAGNDSLNGGDGNDTFLLVTGGDTNGLDQYDGGSGTNTIVGGWSYDTLHVSNNLANLANIQVIDGGDGQWRYNTLLATTGGDTLDFSAITVKDFIMDGGAGDDSITATTGNDYIRGGAGNDVLNGGDGNDTFLLITGSDGNGTDQYGGGTGTNTIIGGWSYDTLHVTNNLANLHNIQVIDGGDGQWRYNTIVADDTTGATLDFSGITVKNFIIAGNAGNDSITATTGNDYIRGGAGNDSLSGGAGDDTFLLITGSDGNGLDLYDGGTGTNTIIGGWSYDTLHVTNNLANLHNIQVIDGGDGQWRYNTITVVHALGESHDDVLDFGGIAVRNFILDSGDGNDYIAATTGDDHLRGSAGNDILLGREGNDDLTDTSGNNLLSGGEDNDALTGGAGNDLLVGGLGNDILMTGTGRDVVLFNLGDGQDTIHASAGTDNTLSLGGGIRYTDLSLSKTGNDLILKTGGSDQITFQGWYASTGNRGVLNLQVIAESMDGYAPLGADTLLDNKIETFDFAGLVNRFDQARAADASLTSWELNDALLDFHLGGGDAEAIGGDLAYQYGSHGTLAGMGLDAAQGVMGDSLMGQPQTLHDPASWRADYVMLG